MFSDKEIINNRKTPEEILPQIDLFIQHKKLEEDYNIETLNYKNLQRHREEIYKQLIRAKDRLERVRTVPLILGQVIEIIDKKTAIVTSMAGLSNISNILSTVDIEKLKPNSTVALNKHSLAIVDIVRSEEDNNIEVLDDNEKPNVQYTDIGGLETQKEAIRESIELPLKKHQLYKKIGIDPPKGVLLYGPPGTGKTMIVKAVATNTNATFIKVSGSEFVQKYLGEGPRKVRDVFKLARERAPSIIFIDEIDAVATTRFDSATSADREVQRVLIELLTQMDGFDTTYDVKIIMATNRADTLDPALLRPGRLDRKIEFPLPDRKQKRLIFNTISSKMVIADDVDFEVFVKRADNISGADIQSICQEAGMQAVRNSRYEVEMADFEIAYNKVLGNKDSGLLCYK